MDTKLIELDGVTLVVPKNYRPPCFKLKDFPDSCGAGKGIGQILVPETFYGLRCAAACHIHDFSWEVAEATWTDFHESNYMFIRNLITIIEAGSSSSALKALRVYRAASYFNAVDTVGASIFWGMKRVAPPVRGLV